MRKIIGVICILAVGGTICLVYWFFNKRTASETFFLEPFLCNGQSCNVILIIPETLSARHMGIYGYERDTTPFIDQFFSEESLVFENAWSNAPWTLPSFAALYTSRIPSDIFVEIPRRDILSEKIPTFVDVLARNEIPKFAGVAQTLEFTGGVQQIVLGGRREVGDKLFTQYESDEIFLARANDPLQFLAVSEWIEKQVRKDNGQPFFLLIHPFAPHDPYDPPEPYRYFFDAPAEYPGPVTMEELWEARATFVKGEEIELEKLQRFCLQYDQEIRYLDRELEAFISRFSREVRQNTVLIFASDHGEAFGQHNNIAHGQTLYEEEIHVPLLVRAPGIEQKRIKEPVTLLDVGPTILEIFGLKSPRVFRGVSLVPVFRGKELQLEDRIVRAELVRDEESIGGWEDWGKIKLRARTEPLPYARETAVRKGNWKLLQLGVGSLELYNLEKDYWEQDNLMTRWHDLPQEEQAEILPLFEALGESPPSY